MNALQSLIEDAYAAGLDHDLWAQWSLRAGRLFGGISTSFHVIDADTQAIRRQEIHHPDPRLVERYLGEEIWRLDPQIPYVATHLTPHVYTDTDHLDLNDHASSEYVRWQLSNGGLRHYMTATVPLGSGRYVGGLSIHRAVADGVTPPDARRMFDMLLPDFRRALQLGFLHGRKMEAAYWDGQFATCDEPTLLLDDQGRIVRHCPAMDRVLTDGDGLGGAGQRLRATDPVSDDRLRGLMAAAIARVPRAGSTRVARPSGRAAYVVIAYPLVRRVRHLAPDEAAALVTIIDPAATPRANAGLWCETFGFTAREQQLAALLVAGHSLESAAAVLAISRNTVRVHLRNLMGKSETSRQSDLVSLLGRIG